MRTLDQWESLLADASRTIECPQMQLIGRDGEPPIFVGPGRIDIRSSTTIDFTMFATPTDSREAFHRLIRARDNPYQVSEQFRLVATDYQGTEWNCGWTLPVLKGIPKVGWPLVGKLNSLVVLASGPFVSSDSGIELIFHPKLDLPMNKMMTSVSSLDDREIERRLSAGEHTIQVLDSEVKFFYKPFNESLWVTARTSDRLPHPFAENWIGEPLRILLGQLIFPRLVARNFGNGTAQIWLRPSPRRFENSRLASLLGESPLGAPAAFWNLYANLLKLIADSKNEEGQPNFESHRITRFYEEISQATQGSRWVLCMTLASAVEGLAGMLMQPNERSLDFPEEDVASLRAAIETWKGDAKLKERALTLFTYLGQRGIASYLRDLVKRGVLLKSQTDAWSEVRNAVMHGSLVSPWATEEEDKRIVALAELVHRITHALIAAHPQSEAGRPPTSN